MSSGGKRRSSSVSDVSGVVAELAMGPPLPVESPLKSSDGGLRASGKDEGKRFKPGSPLTERNGKASADMETDSVVSGEEKSRLRKKNKKSAKKATDAAVGVVATGVSPAGPVSGVSGLGVIGDEMMNTVLGNKIDDEVRIKIMTVARKYEAMIAGLLTENERLKGRLDILQSPDMVRRREMAASAPTGAPVAVAGAAAALPVVKPPETWSVVVKGKTGQRPDEVVEAVKGKLSELGVRVHGVRGTKEGAVIRTPSEAERRKIVEGKKLQDAGLDVSCVDKLGPRITVQRVEKVVTPDEFMEQLYSANLGEIMSKEAFSKSVRLLTKGWEKGEGFINVTLECTLRVAEHLRATGVYVGWYRFLVRVEDVVPACHRCYGFDHRVRNCRFVEDICRLCGQSGHLAARCVNPVHCRNCAIRGKPADHPMVSLQCPVYAMLVARANARH